MKFSNSNFRKFLSTPKVKVKVKISIYVNLLYGYQLKLTKGPMDAERPRALHLA